MQNSDYRKEITEKIIGMLENGTAPWQRPWDAAIAAKNRPQNFNGRPYHGINALMLWCVSMDKGYYDPRWLTFNQIKKLGGRVNKGEKAQIVEYWQWQKQVENPETGEKETIDLAHPNVFRTPVFNAGQCSGLPHLIINPPEWTPHERAENIVAANGVPVSHSTDGRAFYSPGKDYICLPPRESFPTVDAYYSTLLHEVGHSTGHETRLKRDFSGSFGTESYAREELRAELASTFLCGELGIATTGSDEQHAAYVKSWIAVLKDDYNEIFRAAADAEKICTYLYDREKEYLKQKETQLDEPVLGKSSERQIEAQPGLEEYFVARMTPEEAVRKGVFKMPEQQDNSLPREVLVVQMAQNTPMRGKIAFYINDKTYIGDKEYYGSNGLYDNSDNTLEYVSSNDHLFPFVTGRNYAYSAESMLKNEELTEADFEEYKALKENGVLAKFENLRTGDVSFEGKPFDEVYKSKEAMKMADEKTNVKDVEVKPATDAQKAYAMSLGIRFKDEVSKEELQSRIAKRIAANKNYAESLSKPATQNQLDMLKENNIEIKEGMTIGDADKLLSKLPVTPEQMVYMDRIKLEYDKDITRGEAAKLISTRMNYLEKMYELPATEKQVAELDKRGIEHGEKVTVGEFKEKIYFAKPTDKQLHYLNTRKLEYDPEKICYGKASSMIDNHKKYVEMRKELPPTEKQINFLKNNEIEYGEKITRGEAKELIDNYLTADRQQSNEITPKQKEFLEKRDMPTDLDKEKASKFIGHIAKLEKIQNYTGPEGKATINDEYRGHAKKMIEAGKEIDDKKIAGELLKGGYSVKQVQAAIFKCSPANDYNHSLKMVKAAAKMPTVAKKMKENEANRGR